MVKGFDLFKKYFAPFQDAFIVIGGTACDLNFQLYGGFRRTKDIDLIVLTETFSETFATALHAFLHDGGYSCYVTRDKHPHYYRFLSPKNDDYPAQIELLSPSLLPEHPDAPFTPLSLDTEIHSLSAIVLDTDYYLYAKTHRDFTWGVPCLTPDALIVFKSFAYLNLFQQRKTNAKSVRSEDLNKHRNDIFRLLTILPADSRFHLPPPIRSHLHEFIALLPIDSPEWDAINASLGILALPKERYLARLIEIFNL